ncbi:MAG TPA: NAD(P)-dependent oxidoreductase [Steroidobacteraceae bacterium]|nr:NAD(P)-dependent oxidoreductase [Steroidobacteraceae bacterium]
MIVLLTGSRGRIGPAAASALAAAGHEVRSFDLADGLDIRDAASVARNAHGCDAIVHAAGLADDRGGDPADVMAVNLLGTWNVLLAAERLGIRRVVYFSSGKSIGMLERDPDYLPLDDDHRGLPTRPYGLAKWLSEEMCQAFTQRTAIDTICLRAVAVFDTEGYAKALSSPPKTAAPGSVWHLGVHVDVRDVAQATVAAVATHFRGHVRLLLCAADIASSRPTLELVREKMSHVPWRGGPEYEADPYRGLVDIGHLERVLGFRPRYRWPGRQAPTPR